jgi:TolB-like protein
MKDDLGNKKTLNPVILSEKISLFLIVFGILFSLWGCAGQPSKSVYIKDGKEYGKVKGAFRHRWWNYYERGLSFSEGEFYLEAAQDLKEAISKREKDQRKARTYGMHFIDYFPHRELGIVHYQMGNLEAARSELQRSLSQFPTAKANFYLDRVRKALIERDGREVTPPNLTLAFEREEFWTKADPVIISGIAEDERYVSHITINRVPLFLETSQKRISFKETLPLPQGIHTVEVVAKNLPGKVTKRQVVIHVDRQGPLITLEDLIFDQSAPQRAVTIHGSVYDEAGVARLSINGQTIPIQKGVEVFFTKSLTIDKGDLELVAQDGLGNQTIAKIPMTSPPVSRPSLMFAFAGSNWGDLLLARVFGQKDERPPMITLRGWTTFQKVFLEKVYIEGEARDESKIESLTINKHPILRRKGKSIFFSHLADLEEGENTIIIEAGDEAGNRVTKKISVVRGIPKALQLEERLSLTVLPFEQKGAVSEASLSFQDNLIDSLVNQNRFRVVEREKLEVILQEQKLSRTELVDRGTALKLGKLVAARSIITGSIIETRTGIEIVGRMIDTETSEILATEDVYDEVKDLPALRSLAEGMAVKFHRDFPLLDGLVIEQKGEHIFTDLGQDKIKLHRRLLIYRDEPITHPVTGKRVGSDNVIMGRARVTQVMPEMSKAEVLTGKTRSIKRLDKVITE